MLSLIVQFALTAQAPLQTPPGAQLLDGSYIVVFHSHTTPEERQSHLDSLRTKIAAEDESEITAEYAFNSFFGYAAKLSTAALEHVRSDSGVVEFVEQDQVMKASAPVQATVDVPAEAMFPKDNKPLQCSMQLEATWGIVRTASRELNINGEYAYNPDDLGRGVSAYVLDTGIYLEHSEFEGRAVWGKDFVGEAGTSDGNGHGTHCAGTVGSKTYGIAKEATLVAVKVLGAAGSGSNAGVIGGVEFVCEDHEKKANKCVANMSLGGGYSLALNRAVDAAVSCGCSFAVASGNDNRDACSYSPASASDSVSVNAMDQTDRPSWFSNFGTCTDLYAPGTSITSTWIGSPYAINTISGTSMAAPHVAGVMAKYLTKKNMSPAQVTAQLLSEATKDAINSAPRDTPNELLYAPCEL